MGIGEPRAPGTIGDAASFQAPNSAAVEAQLLIEQASSELERIQNAGDHQLPAASTRTILMPLQSRLQTLLGDSSALIEAYESRLSHQLARIHQEFGEYEEAQQYYRRACPYFSTLMESVDAALLLTYLANDPEKHHLSVLLDYLAFATHSQRKLDLAEHLLRSLPWMLTTMSNVLCTTHDKRRILFFTIRALNARHNYHDASREYSVLKALFPRPMNEVDFGALEDERAIFQAGMGFREEALDTFVVSLATSSIVYGVWHRTTLEKLYHFGKFLGEWGDQQIALAVLKECCLGTFYRFGRAHPTSVKVWAELSTYKGAEEFQHDLWRFGDPEYCARNSLSVAYEHSHLQTIMDTLDHVAIDWGRLHAALRTVFAPFTAERDSFVFHRTIARCIYNLPGDTGEEALKALFAYHGYSPVPSVWTAVLEFLEEVTIDGQQDDSETNKRRTKDFLFNMESLPDAEHYEDQVKALCRQLTSLGLTHFTRDILMADPALISEQDSETLGTGAYAVVDTVRIGKKSYARKSVALPRYRQQQIRKAIQNEINVIRTLNHPHVVEIYLTYEDKNRFFIVMEPLADCDLEAFLAQHTQLPSSTAQRRMICNWLLCLSNTLAYIHSKGIRHKDIKPRNILVKGEELIFADFGSSHVFMDEGSSTTEGPSHGHTKMYCAPEVISQGRRNRSADIFSLGCVFTELAIWLPGCKDHDVSKWHEYRETIVDGNTTNSYYASLDKVEKWFSEVNRGTLPGLMYDHVLFDMLCRDPANRPIAVEISQEISRILDPSTAESHERPNCTQCRLDMWVDINKHVDKDSATPSSRVVHLPKSRREPTSSSQSSKEYDTPEVPKNAEPLNRGRTLRRPRRKGSNIEPIDAARRDESPTGPRGKARPPRRDILERHVENNPPRNNKHETRQDLTSVVSRDESEEREFPSVPPPHASLQRTKYYHYPSAGISTNKPSPSSNTRDIESPLSRPPLGPHRPYPDPYRPYADPKPATYFY
jgi:serine/threonine protein kinase/tetratricopeptide (TPR) repeat protein